MTETVVLKNGAVMDARTGRLVAHNNPPMRDAIFQMACSTKAQTKHSLAKNAGMIAEVELNRIYQIAKEDR